MLCSVFSFSLGAVFWFCSAVAAKSLNYYQNHTFCTTIINIMMYNRKFNNIRFYCWGLYIFIYILNLYSFAIFRCLMGAREETKLINTATYYPPTALKEKSISDCMKKTNIYAF